MPDYTYLVLDVLAQEMMKACTLADAAGQGDLCQLWAHTVLNGLVFWRRSFTSHDCHEQFSKAQMLWPCYLPSWESYWDRFFSGFYDANADRIVRFNMTACWDGSGPDNGTTNRCVASLLLDAVQMAKMMDDDFGMARRLYEATMASPYAEHLSSSSDFFQTSVFIHLDHSMFGLVDNGEEVSSPDGGFFNPMEGSIQPIFEAIQPAWSEVFAELLASRYEILDFGTPKTSIACHKYATTDFPNDIGRCKVSGVIHKVFWDGGDNAAEGFREHHSMSPGHWNDIGCRWSPTLCRVLRNVLPSTHRPVPNTIRALPGRKAETLGIAIAWPNGELAMHRDPERCSWQICITGCEGHSWLRVGGEVRPYRQGEVVAFDPSFDHVIWNNGTEPRIVLHGNQYYCLSKSGRGPSDLWQEMLQVEDLHMRGQIPAEYQEVIKTLSTYQKAR
eukprot:gnl/TRDRNA2_/TRDRNA2_40732_c1_seq1.p1 gnl/TRDRNA2_/TRDRNA2_40732_c1~~gnl/TRDRNA2_/TRDRNA2_40732_c1_seq1.p1  ORF type:complete len:506 (+),score=39.32 gnl/TRDRNA2_/TRDRNA2_40732_c1_seq1:184-1518(+)